MSQRNDKVHFHSTDAERGKAETPSPAPEPADDNSRPSMTSAPDTQPMADDDVSIIADVLNGHIDRYAELIDKYQDGAVQLAYNMLGNDEEAKDAAQDAFISAYLSLSTFRRDASFATWFYRIVVNKSHDAARSRAKTPRVAVQSDSDADAPSDGLFDIRDPQADTRRTVQNREINRLLTDAILTLSLRQRLAFVMHHLRGMSLAEVADVMECEIGTVKSHIFRAVEQIRKQLEPFVTEEVPS